VTPCPRPLDVAALLAWWHGDALATEQDALEEHLFACAHCFARMQQLQGLMESVRQVVREGATASVALTHAAVERLAHDGVPVREYRVPPNGAINCNASRARVQLLHLELPPGDDARLDLVFEPSSGAAYRLEDLPADRPRGEIALAFSGEEIRRLPDQLLELHLLAVDAAGERELARYTLRHSARLDHS
jgi:hypothetical protein